MAVSGEVWREFRMKFLTKGDPAVKCEKSRKVRKGTLRNFDQTPIHRYYLTNTFFRITRITDGEFLRVTKNFSPKVQSEQSSALFLEFSAQ